MEEKRSANGLKRFKESDSVFATPERKYSDALSTVVSCLKFNRWNKNNDDDDDGDDDNQSLFPVCLLLTKYITTGKGPYPCAHTFRVFQTMLLHLGWYRLCQTRVKILNILSVLLVPDPPHPVPHVITTLNPSFGNFVPRLKVAV